MTTEQDLLRMKKRGVLTEKEYKKALSQLKIEKHQGVLESEKIKQRILFSIALLGIFSILTGLGLIVAANWAIIPATIKISGGLICLAASLLATIYFQKNENNLWKEAFLFVSFLLVGGNIALVQQSYHLGLSWQEGSMVWWGFSLPLIFFTKYKLLPLCSVGLLGFSVWDIIWNINYMAIVGMCFVVMLTTHFFNGTTAKFLRQLSFLAAIFFLYEGDILENTATGIVGVITTTVFLIFALNTPKTETGIINFYNYLFLLAAWRIFLLFWSTYYNLTNIGILLIVFGTVLLTGVGLYTYYYKQIQILIKGLIKHE